MSSASSYIYHHNQQVFKGYLSLGQSQHLPRPVVLVVHDWSGCNQFAIEQTKLINQLGYIGFAVDMYGEGQVGTTIEEKKALMAPLMDNRSLIPQRLQAALDLVSNFETVDRSCIAVIGFCFGGLCALDFARSGANIKGVVSFHGLLNRAEQSFITPITAKILALHGYDDPMVPPSDVNQFCQEMTKSGADWQLHAYGQTQHGFTNPEAHDHDLGTVYNACARHRAFESMANFLKELFVSA